MKEEIIEDLKKKCEKLIAGYRKNLGRVRTGRATPSILEGIRVSYYGALTPLNQVATISVQGPRTLVIQPWDQTVLKEIEKAIMKSDLDLMPTNDGKVIRINIPPLTEERRKELTKVVKKMAEECKVLIREARRDAISKFKKLKTDKKISEDDFYRSQDDVQKVIDKFIERVDDILKEKESEILKV